MRRGPDEAGVKVSGSVALGHNLLRIFPDAMSRQPMASDDGRLSICFNGEIYNYLEIREQLGTAGIRFRTDTDTEVILRAYEHFGTDFVAKLNGMFALVIHDAATGRVIVARDRFGQKPLYCFMSSRLKIFSSSISSILAHPDVAVDVDEQSLREYLHLLDTFDNRTLFKGVRHFPAATLSVFSDAAVELHAEQFVETTFQADPGKGAVTDKAVDLCYDLFAKSAKRQSRVGGPLAAHLSGGLDSSAIVATLRGEAPQDLRTYCCTYGSDTSGLYPGEEEFEEAHYAAEVAASVGVSHGTVSVSPSDYYDIFPALVEALEEPKGNSCVPHFLLAREISGSARVFFSGEGGDEFFGGYWWKYALSQNPVRDERASAYFSALCAGDESWLSSLGRIDPSVRSNVRNRFQADFDRSPSADALDEIMSYESRHFMQYLLVQADKLAGYFSLEGRYPFLDNDLFEFVRTSPVGWRHDPTQPSKHLLRRAMRGRLPAHILDRKKMGFVAPEGGWYRSVLSPLVRAVLLRQGGLVSGLIGINALEDVLSRHERSEKNYRKLIWGLMSLELWHAHFIQGSDVTEVLCASPHNVFTLSEGKKLAGASR
ncbi:asparagine synthase (glutamine-hydrolyzing) [Microvirga flocculans]|uniref:asparagine synthase (glutamine-hydrolyzing) n=2 Tax=Microvirga flocculans TaxID=217168 RepID=A0A7W6IHM3_9HYPH|nr:asparagine synthase (glutamine-hydrolyzing) [Microvirga flocculans]